VEEVKRLAPSGTVFPPGHHQKYLWLSLQIYTTLISFTPLIEPYSIGEAFLDLSGNREAQADPAGFARRIKHRIAADFKLTCSIGIGSNKLIAKVASDFRKPNGMTMIKLEKTMEWLHTLAIERLPGIGVKTTEYLHGLNIGTIGELALVDEAVLVSWFGRNGSLLYKMAWGREDGMVYPELSQLKSMSQEWTLPSDSTNREEIEEYLKNPGLEVSDHLPFPNRLPASKPGWGIFPA
jgi:DNA polymerase-4